MTSTSNTPAGAPDASTAQSQPSQPVPTSQRRPLQREGAVYILSPAEQALADAMLRSSPPPEQVLGKRPHEEDDEEDPGRDTEPDEGTSTSAQAQSLVPSLGNITGTTLRYATYKKLRAEQCDELEAFLQVSTSLTYFGPSVQTSTRNRHWVVKPNSSSVSFRSKTKLIPSDQLHRLTRCRMD
jgi:hypothetical protein